MNPEQTSLRGMVYASLFGALTAVGAYIMIPLPPVPITLQTLFLGLAGMLLGVFEALASGYLDPLLGAGSRDLVVAATLILTIVIRPHGLFGRHDIERI